MTQINLFDTEPPHIGLDPSTAPKRFSVLYADPPWDYHDRTFLNAKANATGSASDHYPTMSSQDLMDMHVQSIAAKNCILYMWTTGPQLQISMDVLCSWGFRYRTIAFIWEKAGRVNPGHYTMSSCELCLVAVKGKVPHPRGTRNERQFYSTPRTKHSQKPSHFRDCITRMHPSQSKLELFSRDAAPGWFVWGLEAPQSIQIPQIWGNTEIPW
mgnify:CR=1 FL=1